MPRRDVIVIGASAGGFEALRDIFRRLPADLPAAILVVLHISAMGVGKMAAVFDGTGQLPVSYPSDGDEIRSGHIYLAPPDRHLLVENARISLGTGPRENFVRPAIDPLFRSAASVFGPRTIGVVLTGRLDDGTMGLREIRRHGGIAVVQTPETAEYPDMPLSAIRNGHVDYSVPLSKIPSLLVSLVAGIETPAQKRIFEIE